MMNDTAAMQKQVQKMLSIIHQIPVGLVQSDLSGAITQINAKGVQLLMPFFMHYELGDANNILSLLDKMLPGFAAVVRAFNKESGNIILQENYEIDLRKKDSRDTRHFFFTVNKIDANFLSFMFDDITEFYERERKINQVLHDQAVEKSKFEMASNILHDIGNAVVGFGSYLTRVKRHLSEYDHDTLVNLENFFRKQQPQLIPIFGEAKTQALLDLLDGLILNQKKSKEELNKSLGEQMNIVTHISEILNIQRQYIRGQESTIRDKVSIRNIVNDCLSMLMPTLHKRNIIVQSNIPVDLPLIVGDKTRLMQVFLNLLKNAAESIVIGESDTRQIDIVARVENDELEVIMKDTGAGIDPDVLPKLFTRGVTTKTEGNGLGLANCRAIIESHDGRLILKSGGTGKGAEAIVHFKI